eukprot:c8048_g1_i1 orf=55-2388(+)
MSILQLASADKFCDKHPQERVVGVCGACLAHKLTSLIHTTTAPAPEIVNPPSQLVGSSLTHPPPLSINPPAPHRPLHHPDHLRTIDEEADSSAQELLGEGPHCSDLDGASSAVEVCAEAKRPGNDLVQLSIIHEENSSSSIEVPSISEEKPSVNQEISSISEVRPSIKEEILIIDQENSAIEEGTPTRSPQIHTKKPLRCRRSKSLSVPRSERAAHGHELAARSLVERTGEQSIGAEKVTLRALFQLDDQEKCRNRALDQEVCDQFSANGRPIEEESHKGLIGELKIEEAKDAHKRPQNQTDKNLHAQERTQNQTDQDSHGCVPSTSKFSSSVCPHVPDRLKHSVLLNSLLCRKAQSLSSDAVRSGSNHIRKPSQVHEANRNSFLKIFNEDGFAQASDEGGFTRATYIASESRVMRRCRSKLERCITASSSQPASPSSISHVIDSKSERKFNLSARALAVDIPSILRSSAEAADVTTVTSLTTLDSFRRADHEHDVEELKEGHEMSPGASIDAEAGALAPQTRPVIPLVITGEEEQHLADCMASTAREVEGQIAMEFTPILRKIKKQDEEEQGEMIDSPPPPTPLPLNPQPPAGDMAILSSAKNNLEGKGDTLAGAVQEEEVECQNSTDNQSECRMTATENGQILECRNATDNQPIPAYITARESSLAGQEACAVYGRSLSCKASSSNTGKQSSHNLAEGVWEPYSAPGRGAGFFGRSASRHSKWPSSSRTVKIAPDQSGLLRFYLTPLRASGRTRFSSPRRPPKRHLWSFVFQGAH